MNKTFNDRIDLGKKIADKCIEVCGADVAQMVPIFTILCLKEGVFLPPNLAMRIIMTAIATLLEDEKLILKERTT